MKSSSKSQFRLAELISGLDVTIKGDPDCIINGISPIQQSKPGHITFLTNPLYRKYLSNTQASAVILTEEEAEICPVHAIVSGNPYYTYARIAALFADEPFAMIGIHPTAVIAKESEIHPTASISANCFIGQHVIIGPKVKIGPGCTIADQVTIGEGTTIEANVSIHHKVKIGKNSHLSSGVVIGSDGFGFANQSGVWHKIPQLGSVTVGDHVDIGANTTIDRGAIDDTVIENGVKLDNLIQIGHNVQIGENTIIAGCTAIAGSTIIGKNCVIGGAVCFAGHIVIGDNIMITGMTAVTKSIKEAGVYSSGIVGAVPNQEFRKNNARFHRLENLMERVKKLEKSIKEMIVSKEV